MKLAKIQYYKDECLSTGCKSQRTKKKSVRIINTHNICKNRKRGVCDVGSTEPVQACNQTGVKLEVGLVGDYCRISDSNLFRLELLGRSDGGKIPYGRLDTAPPACMEKDVFFERGESLCWRQDTATPCSSRWLFQHVFRDIRTFKKIKNENSQNWSAWSAKP